MSTKKTLWEKYYIHTSIFTLILFFFYLFWFQTSFFHSSILDYKLVKSDIFDWTVYPIEFVPDPLQLTYEQRKQEYSQIDSKYFIKTPTYSPNIFEKNLDDYKVWSNDYSQIITQRLVFSVPYLWTYNYDFKEYTWSHPWVDIIAPEWTPVRNIASWIVVDVWYQPGWFWKYVLVKHNDVTLVNWKKWNIYSLYAHLFEVDVNAWVKLKKWELLWLVGETGTATTPHLHFQIDVDTAPYSPYWPFSTADMKASWVWFFDWVNIWLWKENALTYTINPLEFVNKNLTNVYFTSTNEATSNETEKIDTKESKTQDNIIEEITTTNTNESNEILKQDTGTKEEILVATVSSEINTENITKENTIENDVELLSALDAKDILAKTDIKIALASADKSILALNEEDLQDLSESFDKIDENSDILTQSWGFDLIPNLEEEITQSWEVLNETLEVLNEEIEMDSVFSDIGDDYKFLDEVKYFKENNIISWFSDGSFRPKNNVTRVEALKIMLLANKVEIVKFDKSLFADISANSWENNYVIAWVEAWIVDSNNKYFSPFRNVSRVEALKIILTLWKVDFTRLENDLKFRDVSESDWFYKYVNYAMKNNLFEIIWNKFEPNKALTREELVSILYKYIQK